MDNRIKKIFIALIIINYQLSIIGCTNKNRQITYADHIAPIIYNHCTTCHRPGSAGTFNLISFDDVRKHAKQIELVTRARVMPPWPADYNYSHFAGENYLTDEEINLIKTWVENGAPEGDKKAIPASPSFTEGS